MLQSQKMWSIASIIGAATAASTALLIVGIFLAVKIERRRYRKYLERHTAGISLGIDVDNLHSADDPEHALAQRKSARKSVLLQSATTWMTLPSSESIEEIADATQEEPSLEPKLAEKRNFRTNVKKLERKKHGSRRRLKRNIPHGHVMSSPLSAIAESSDMSNHSPEIDNTSISVASTPALENQSEVDPIQWEFSIPKKRNPQRTVLLARANSASHTSAGSRPSQFSRSISLESSLSPVPNGPLPPLPAAHLPRIPRFSAESGASHSSGESIDSALLHSNNSSPARSFRSAEKAPSQALQEFEFGLKSISPLQSSTQASPCIRQSMRLGRNLPGGATFLSHVPLKNPSFHPATPDSRPDSIKSDTGLSGDLTPKLTNRHSMIEPRKLSTNGPDVFSSETNGLDNRSVATDLALRPLSTRVRIPLQELDCKIIAHRTSICSLGSTKGHKRQNCIRISNLPLVSATAGQHLQVTAKAKTSVDPVSRNSQSNGSIADSVMINDNLGAQFPRIPSSHSSFMRTGSLKERVDTRSQTDLSMPETPESGHAQRWHFDFVPFDTPQSQIRPSPLRSYHSPTLPPPVFSSSNNVPYLRRSQVRGPRNPRTSRGHSPSLRKPRAAPVTGNHMNPVPRLHVQDIQEPVPLHKSVAMLRQLSSESQLVDLRSDSEQEKENLPPRQSPLLMIPTHLQPLRNVPSSSFLTVPTTGNLHLKPSVNVSRSSLGDTLEDEASVWEDMSIREESPLPSPYLDMGTSTSSVFEKHHNHSGRDISRSSTGTPRAQLQDYEMYQDFVENYGKNVLHNGTAGLSRYSDSHEHERCTAPLGLGLQTNRAGGVRGSFASEKPGSMYDESGFLKE